MGAICAQEHINAKLPSHVHIGGYLRVVSPLGLGPLTQRVPLPA